MISLFFEVVSALFFALSSGILSNQRFRKNRWLVLVTGIIALVTTYGLVTEIVSETYLFQTISSQPSLPRSPSIPARPPESPPTMLDRVVHGTFAMTKDVSNWFIREGTGDKARSVSDETVLQIIIGILVSIAFALIGLAVRTISGWISRRAQ